jgi:hypothetical protein
MSRRKLPEQIKQTIEMEKCLISILWFVGKVHSLTVIAKEMTQNTVFFCNYVMFSLIIENDLSIRQKMLKRFVTSMNNSHPHNSRLTQKCILASMSEHLQHSASSSDSVPSDCFLFGYMKGKLINFNCPTREELRITIIGVFAWNWERDSHIRVHFMDDAVKVDHQTR